MFETIRSFLEAMKAPSIEARENAWLEESVDRYDLEYRQRQIDLGLFRKPRGMFGGFPVLQ